MNPLFLMANALALCSTACGSTALPTNYFNCVNVTRKFGYKYFVLMSCDIVWLDILDTAEWSTHIVAGDIICSPPGMLTPVAPDQTLVDIDCDSKVTTDITYTLDFVTYQSVAGAVTDCDFFQALFNNASAYRLLWFDCIPGDERWAVQDDWKTAIAAGAPATVSGTHPGFGFSITQIPFWQAGDGDRGQWVTQFQIEHDGMICNELIPGAAAIVCA